MIETPRHFTEKAEGRNNPVNTLAQRVTIRRVEDIHDAAVALHEMSQTRGFRVAACDDISSKEPMIDADGAMDRQAMREQIFKNTDAKAKLEAIIHPLVSLITAEQAQAALKNGQRCLVFDVPLLVEVGVGANWDEAH